MAHSGFEEYVPSCLANTVFAAGAYYFGSYNFSAPLSAMNSEPLEEGV